MNHRLGLGDRTLERVVSQVSAHLQGGGHTRPALTRTLLISSLDSTIRTTTCLMNVYQFGGLPPPTGSEGLSPQSVSVLTSEPTEAALGMETRTGAEPPAEGAGGGGGNEPGGAGPGAAAAPIREAALRLRPCTHDPP